MASVVPSARTLDGYNMKYRKAAFLTIQGLALMLVGSLVVGPLLDHFPGWFGIAVEGKPRMVVLGVVILGTYLYSSHRVLKELKAVRAAGQQNG
jgi:hypothetical protein